jgi:uncharacterized protein
MSARMAFTFYDLVEQDDHRISVREFNSAMSALRRRPKETPAKCQQTTPFEIISVDVNGNFSTFSPELLGLRSLKYGDFTFGNVEADSFESPRDSEKFQAVKRDHRQGHSALPRDVRLLRLLRRRRAGEQIFRERAV